MPLYKILPEAFYNGPVPMIEAFTNVGALFGDSSSNTQQLFGLLPPELKHSPAFYLLLTKKWCYEFGEEFDRMPQDHRLVGSEQFPEIEQLYSGLQAANKHLTNSQLLTLIRRLSNPAKHLETLGELAPLVRIKEDTSPEYEVEGYGQGNRTIDWLFEPSVGIPVLLDVKYRISDLIQHMSEIIPALNAGENQILPPSADPALLFKDTVEKFVPRSHDESLQGVWIHSHIKQHRGRLNDYFDSLDPERLHFAILSRWRGDAYILYRNGIDKAYLYHFFTLNHTDNFVF